MKRCLFYGESPHNTTGFANVNKHLAAAIWPVCELEYVASSHWGHPDDEKLPYVIHRCPEGDTSTEAIRNLAKIMERLNSGEWDIFFYQGDIGANDDVIVRACQLAQDDPSKFTIYYVPLDVDSILLHVFDVARICDVQVFYTQRGADLAMAQVPEMVGKCSAIGLGTEPDVFFPLIEEERRVQRKRIFGIEDDTFIVINVNRNQMRKDLARTMACFHQFHELYPHSLLYMHSVIQDYGGNLMLQAKMVGCDLNASPTEIAFSGLDLNKPWSREDLNTLYNAADVLVSTSYGEGWGLSTTEAMCAGCPVVVPMNTANYDIIGANQERGWGVRTGGDVDHTAFLYEGGGAPHDVCWSDDFVYKLSSVYWGTMANEHHDVDWREYKQKKVQAARAWCLENTWEHKAVAWRQVIEILSGDV
jgi:glycosyltransferase involved in cell wall biosynthesis